MVRDITEAEQVSNSEGGKYGRQVVAEQEQVTEFSLGKYCLPLQVIHLNNGVTASPWLYL